MPPKIRRSLHKLKIICEQCKIEVKEEDDDIQCDECKKTFHAICSKLDKRQYEHLLEYENEEYVCHMCSEDSGNITKELNVIKTKQIEIKERLNKLDQLDELCESMQFMSNQFEVVLKTIADNTKKLEAVENENKKLKTELNDLKLSVKILNDNRVKNDCIINGVEVKQGVDAVETVVNMLKDVGVDLQPKEIEEAYFLKKRNEECKTQSMVVKFSNKSSKKTVMSIKPKLKEKENTKSVFINDYLSKETLSLLKYAKSLKEVGYRRVYPSAGKVFTKRSELSKPKIIQSFEDVDSLLLQSTQNRRSVRRGKISAQSSDEEEEGQDPYLSPV